MCTRSFALSLALASVAGSTPSRGDGRVDRSAARRGAHRHIRLGVRVWLRIQFGVAAGGEDQDRADDEAEAGEVLVGARGGAKTDRPGDLCRLAFEAERAAGLTRSGDEKEHRGSAQRRELAAQAAASGLGADGTKFGRARHGGSVSPLGSIA